MKKNNKRAFTIVELVIVIAVIAILAAVLIPTFSSLIKKANMNADKAAVKSMNTYLSADEQINGKPTTLQEVLSVLGKSNMDAENYKALASGYQIVWDSGLNAVLYTDMNGVVVYPEEYAPGGSKAPVADEYGDLPGIRVTLLGQVAADESWRLQVLDEKYADFSKEYDDNQSAMNSFVSAKEKIEAGKTFEELTEDEKTAYNQYSSVYGNYYANDLKANVTAVEFKNDTTTTVGTLTFTTDKKDESGKLVSYTLAKVTTAEQLVSYIEYVKKSSDNGADDTLYITSNINFQGAQWIPLAMYAGNIDGCAKTLDNFTMSDSSQEVSVYEGSTEGGAYFYYGFVSVFEGEYFGNLTFENVNIDRPGREQDAGTLVKAKTGHVSAVAIGCVISREGTTTTIENIVVNGGTIKGLSRTGGIIGNIGAKDINTNEKTIVNAAKGTVYIKNCVNKADVSSECSQSFAHGTVGGIICGTYANEDEFKLYVQDCKNYGNVTGTRASGILGFTISNIKPNQIMQFDRCENYGTITATMPSVASKLLDRYNYEFLYAAGIAGNTNGNGTYNFNDCKNAGNIVVENNDETHKFTGTPAIYMSGIGNVGNFNSCTNTGTFKVNIATGVDGANIPADVNFRAGNIASGFNSSVQGKFTGCVSENVNPEFSSKTGYFNDKTKMTIVNFVNAE